MEESRIFDDAEDVDVPALKGETEVSLLKTGSLFDIYRIFHDGKFFLFKTGTGKRAQKLLRREYELSAGCTHPNVVNVTAFGEILPGKTGILMDYVDGRNLLEYIAENPSYKERRRIFEELLSAVDYLHKRGIIHNDLKPENILISRYSDSLKLIDLGLSDNDAQVEIKTPGFTPDYAAPELREKRSSDIRSDIYSVGRIIIDMFAGRYERISRKSMSASPEKRYQNISELKKAFERRRASLIYSYTGGAIVVLIFLSLFLLKLSTGGREDNVSIEDTQQISEAKVLLDDVNDSEINQVEPENPAISEVGTEGEESLDPSLKKSEKKIEPVIMLEESPSGVINEKEHREAVENHIVNFKREMQRIEGNTSLRISTMVGPEELKAILQDYGEEAFEFYNQYMKNVEGEDISARIKGEYDKARSRASARFQKEVSKIE